MVVKFLITGGCGFIGSHLAETLVENGYGVRILDDLSNGKKEQIPKEAELIVGSITDPHIWPDVLKGISGVFHLAAIPSVVKSVEEWHASHMVNCGGTIQLFEEAREIPIIYATTAAVYGDAAELPIKESTPARPLSPYAVDKLSCEMHAQLAWHLHQTKNIGFRIFNVFGARQDPRSPYSGVISIFLKQILQKKPLTIYGDGEQKRDFIYVKDVAKMLLKAMEQPFQGADVYNLCSGQEITINALADLMSQIANVKIELIYAPQRTGEVRFSKGDPSKAWNALGIKAETSLYQGLREMMQEMATEGIVRA